MGGNDFVGVDVVMGKDVNSGYGGIFGCGLVKKVKEKKGG